MNAWQQTLKILGRRAQSSARLKEKLLSAGATQDEAAQAVGQAIRLRLINDADYAQMLAAQEQRRGRGPLRLRAALLAHGLDPEIIKETMEKTMDQDTPETFQRAQEALRKKISHNSTMTPAKAYGYLLRQGYPSSVARQAAKISFEGDWDE